jgi:hypothetical protein
MGALNPFFGGKKIFFVSGRKRTKRLHVGFDIHGPVGSIFITFKDLKHPGASKTLEHFGGFMLFTALGQEKRMTEKTTNSFGEVHQVLVAAPNPDHFF